VINAIQIHKTTRAAYEKAASNPKRHAMAVINNLRREGYLGADGFYWTDGAEFYRADRVHYMVGGGV
jgi:hypothetical protein